MTLNSFLALETSFCHNFEKKAFGHQHTTKQILKSLIGINKKKSS